MLKNKISDYRPKEDKFWGMYRGVIEDRVDPDKLGRCRIRVFGIHDGDIDQDNIKGIPTDQLPWAEPVMGLFEGSMSGHGVWSVPLQGSHVMVFFEAGNWMQPRYFATVPGKPTEAPDATVGFNDPDEVYPVEVDTYPPSDLKFKQGLDESDFHRLARNESTDESVVQYKDDNLDLNIKVADKSHNATATTWDEPESAYAAEYPDNIVFSTHGGHTIEIDCTEGEERIHVYHPSHSYIEIDKDGNMVIRNNKSSYEIVVSDKNIHIQGNENKTIDVDQSLRVGNDKMDWIGNDEDRHIMNDVYEHIENDEWRQIDRDCLEEIGRDETKDVGRDHTETIGNDRTEDIGNDETRTVGNDLTEDIGNDLTISVANNITITAGGRIKIQATGNVDIDGARIDLN